MRKLLRWVFAGMVILLVPILGITIYVLVNKDDIQQYVVDELNKNINARADVKRIETGLLHHFPYVSAIFREVVVIPYHQEGFPAGDTLLNVDRVSLDFNLWSVLTKKRFQIRSFDIENGNILLLRGPDGKTNWNIWRKGDGRQGRDSLVTIRSLAVSGVKIRYRDLSGGWNAEMDCNSVRVTANPLQKNQYRVKGEGNLQFVARGKKSYLQENIPFQVAGFIGPDKNGNTLQKGKIILGEEKFFVEGALDKSDHFRIVAEGREISPYNLWGLFPFPEAWDPFIPGIKDKISIRGQISGIIGEEENFEGNVDFEVNKWTLATEKEIMNAEVTVPKGNIIFRKEGQHLHTTISARDFLLKTGNTTVRGDFMWNEPGKNGDMVLTLRPSVSLEDLQPFFRNANIQFSQGHLRGKIKAIIPFTRDKRKMMIDRAGISIEGEAEVDQVRGGFDNRIISTSGMSGTFKLGKEIDFSGVRITWLGFPVMVSGKMSGLQAFLSGGETPVIDISMQADSFRLDTLFGTLKSMPETKDQTTQNNDNPVHLICDFQVQNFFYGKLFAGIRSGHLDLKSGQINITGLEFETLGGTGTGQMEWQEEPSGESIVRAYTDFKHVNIKEMFSVFDDFGQTFIRSSNIGGDVTGSVAVQLQVDRSGKVVPETILSNASVEINEGSLKDAEALYSLSKFIRLSELKDIRFSTLKNDFFIQDEKVVIPSMHIGSSALDLDVYGTHSFHGDFQYHIHLLLSDILFQKARKAQENSNEFGIVEEDNEGKTGLYLVYEGDREHSRVYYDKSKAKQVRKEEWSRERQDLKSILREELGLFKSDSASMEKDEKAKKRFHLIFQDDTIRHKNDTLPGTEVKYRIRWDDDTIADTTGKRR